MFATQLNALCARPEPQVPNVMLAQALADRGCKVSKPYLSQRFRIATEFFFTPPVTVDAITSSAILLAGLPD